MHLFFFSSNILPKDVKTNSMKKLFVFLSTIFCFSLLVPSRQASAEEMASACKSAYLMDCDSGTVLYERKAEEHLPIASMCKIMTLLLCFESADNGSISLDQTITVSERAASMGGSQVYLESGGAYRIGNLLESIIVCSANDSCVAMAEAVAGSEALFVDRMNERAKELGANDTLFSNCTGLPKETQYSCAKDVALMLRELLHHPKYYEYSTIRTDTFQHPGDRVTEITNTNRLLRSYDGCDSGKTGFTNQAGFCLAASAKRGNMRVISVTIGSPDSTSRFEAHKELLDYAFANYTNKIVVDSEHPLQEKVAVSGGKQEYAAIKAERNSYVFGKKGEKEEITKEIRLSPVKAPIEAGDVVGQVIVYRNRIEADTVNLVAAETVEEATIWDNYKKAAGMWAF